MEERCEKLRAEVRDLAVNVRKLLRHSSYETGMESHEGQHGEMKANTMLAFRHLEDARMRLGKVLQQIQGGMSVYDRDDVR